MASVAEYSAFKRSEAAYADFVIQFANLVATEGFEISP